MRAAKPTRGSVFRCRRRVTSTATATPMSSSVHGCGTALSVPTLGWLWCSTALPRGYRWTVEWDRSTLERILTTTLPSRSRRVNGPVEVRDIRIRKRSKSGRVKELEIKTQQGNFRVKGDEVRSVLRRPGQGSPLRSTLFSLKVDKDRRGRPRRVVASGGGFGHGIGLCQYGAIGMASRGYRFDQILRHYYRGIDLRRLY